MYIKYFSTKKLFLFVVFFVAAFFQNSFASQPKNLAILAEPSMVEALTKIARIYSRNHSTTISISFADSSQLIQSIEDGESSDVFISAHRYWIDILKQKGLVDIYNIGHITNDSLVLVTSKENFRIPSELLASDLDFFKSLEILNKYNLNLIIDNEGSSLGQYSKQMLKNLGMTSIRTYEKLLEDRTSVPNLIKNNPDSYAIFLSSQIKENGNFRLISRLKNQQIFYQALVIAGDNMDIAREFVKFLKTKQVQRIFEESGFIVD
jgi:molybdenum ABC transporter molybdate-binding protein